MTLNLKNWTAFFDGGDLFSLRLRHPDTDAKRSVALYIPESGECVLKTGDRGDPWALEQAIRDLAGDDLPEPAETWRRWERPGDRDIGFSDRPKHPPNERRFVVMEGRDIRMATDDRAEAVGKIKELLEAKHDQA